MTRTRSWSLRRLAALALDAVRRRPRAGAQAPSTTILKRGKVLVGMDMSAPPFAYQDEKQQPAGSEVETARLHRQGSRRRARDRADLGREPHPLSGHRPRRHDDGRVLDLSGPRQVDLVLLALRLGDLGRPRAAGDGDQVAMPICPARRSPSRAAPTPSRC